MRQRLNVLLVCFVASPQKGSEFGVGWGWLSSIARSHDVWVITNSNSREDIEAFQSDEAALPNVNFIYVSWSLTFAGSRLWPFIRFFRYMKWRKAAARAAVNIGREVEFDLCHYVNGVGFLDVVPLWRMNVPFVWGPIGGMTLVHPALFKYLPSGSRLFYRLKNSLRKICLRFHPLPRRASMEARTLIAATPEIERNIESIWQRSATIIPEIGLKQIRIADTKARMSTAALRIVWCGRIDSGKALNILLESLPYIPSTIDWELHVVGSGPRLPAMQELAACKGVAGQCVFHGQLSYERAQCVLERGHVFVFTSIYDLTSSVVVEAMACSVPLVCLSSHSVAAAVEGSAGLVVDVDRQDICAGIAAALLELGTNEPRRMELGSGARSLAESYLWDNKAAQISDVYSRVHDESV